MMQKSNLRNVLQMVILSAPPVLMALTGLLLRRRPGDDRLAKMTKSTGSSGYKEKAGANGRPDEHYNGLRRLSGHAPNLRRGASTLFQSFPLRFQLRRQMIAEGAEILLNLRRLGQRAIATDVHDLQVFILGEV